MVDLVSLVLGVASGAANGTFPIFIKTPRVLAADVHPVVFQLYKSAWVCFFGCALLAIQAAQGAPLVFTPWASASAAAWIPSGLATIVAVPLVGVGTSVLATAATGSVLSFLVFWLGFHEKVKYHDVFGAELPAAPAYLLGSVVGMAGLVYAQRLSDPVAAPTEAAIDEDGLLGSPTETKKKARLSTAALGFFVAALGGVFSALQYALVTAPSPRDGDPRFDPLGCWTFAFGLSALVWTLLAWAAFCVAARRRGDPAPGLQLDVMMAPGAGAGIFWSVANLFGTLAVLRGGNALAVAQINAASLISSGLWGLLYYREIRGRAALYWCAAAVFTGAMTVMLSFEKA
mmetsp:Transcript_20690/g.65067  ORF Transcript_20690/g.65067 Transcript_20690/m.65067 type:complete len:345 (-) Transcript_20690:73-1107(-)